MQQCVANRDKSPGFVELYKSRDPPGSLVDASFMHSHSYGPSGPSGYTQDGSVSPSMHPGGMASQFDPAMPTMMVSPDVGGQVPLVSPGPSGMPPGHSPVMMGHGPTSELLQYSAMVPPQGQHHPRPHHQHRQSYHQFVPNMQRPSSAQTTRSDSPHMLGGDVFGGAVPTPSMGGSGVVMDAPTNGHHMPSYDFNIHEVSRKLRVKLTSTAFVPRHVARHIPGPCPRTSTPATTAVRYPQLERLAYDPDQRPHLQANHAVVLFSIVQHGGGQLR